VSYLNSGSSSASRGFSPAQIFLKELGFSHAANIVLKGLGFSQLADVVLKGLGFSRAASSP
jgi:hypothetical protein